MYIYENQSWPKFTWRIEELTDLLSKVSFLQGNLLGKMQQLGFDLQQEAFLHNLTDEITKSSEIEGENLNSEQVRSSIARRLNIKNSNSIISSHHIDGIVEMMVDATHNYNAPLTKERICGWHAALFPTGYSGMYKIKVGDLRDDADGPMQVVSSKSGREIIYYEAPQAKFLPEMLQEFLNWFNSSISAQIQKEKKMYYQILESTQKGDMDITGWLKWFLECLLTSMKNSESLIEKIMQKSKLWQKFNLVALDDNQRKIINMLFDGFEGNLTSGKWAKICKCSQDTAGRSLKYLVENDILEQVGAGRSTHYILKCGD